MGEISRVFSGKPGHPASRKAGLQDDMLSSLLAVQPESRLERLLACLPAAHQACRSSGKLAAHPACQPDSNVVSRVS